MIGAILAGGFGKRLRPLTDKIPKALIEIGKNYTIMDRQLLDFRRSGIKEIYVLTSYLGNVIEERYGKTWNGLKLTYLPEDKPLGKLFSLRNLINEAGSEDVLLRNGDTISDIDMKEFIRFSSTSDYSLVIHATRMRSPYGIIETSGTRITGFREKPLLETLINSGLYYVKKDAFPLFFQEYEEKEIETTVFPLLAEKGLAGVFRDDSFWVGIDSDKDLETARHYYEGRVDMPWGSVKTNYEGKNFTFYTYDVYANESLELQHKNSIIRVIRGNLDLNGNARLAEGSVLEIADRLKIKAGSRTIIEVVQKS
jgi:NDP-sugar pyrophosphorylase family protein